MVMNSATLSVESVSTWQKVHIGVHGSSGTVEDCGAMAVVIFAAEGFGLSSFDFFKTLSSSWLDDFALLWVAFGFSSSNSIIAGMLSSLVDLLVFAVIACPVLGGLGDLTPFLLLGVVHCLWASDFCLFVLSCNTPVSLEHFDGLSLAWLGLATLGFTSTGSLGFSSLPSFEIFGSRFLPSLSILGLLILGLEVVGCLNKGKTSL
mmetsp:Transcript_94155/g.162841  ORF Transcript_94155/g.162841 Transcript_94155/m.162841 type:complete len:205 (-) Transcript_94155:1299-1913(-)